MTILPDTGLPDNKIFPEPDIGYRIPDSGSDIRCFQTHQADSGKNVQKVFRSNYTIRNQNYESIISYSNLISKVE